MKAGRIGLSHPWFEWMHGLPGAREQFLIIKLRNCIFNQVLHYGRKEITKKKKERRLLVASVILLAGHRIFTTHRR
jgi:hypothetical protein